MLMCARNRLLWTLHTSERIAHMERPKGRLCGQGGRRRMERRDGQKNIGSAARDVGPHDLEDAARAGPAARVRHCAAHRAGEPRRAPAERGHGVHLVAAAATAGMDSAAWGTSENNRKAKFYSITRRGRKQLEVETENWERISDVIRRVLRLEAERCHELTSTVRLRFFAAKLRGFFRGQQGDDGFDEEIQEHLRLLAEQIRGAGDVEGRGRTGGATAVRQHHPVARGP